MTKYENLLFNGKKRAQKGANNDEDLNPLNWNISAYECILNGWFVSCNNFEKILSFCR